MKKYSKIMIQALSIATIFALTNNCSIKAVEPTVDQTNLAVKAEAVKPIVDQTNLAVTTAVNTLLLDKTDAKDGNKHHREHGHHGKRKHKKDGLRRKFHEEDKDDEMSADHFEEKVSKQARKFRKDPASLYNQFLKIKNTDAAKPKALKDIASITDDAMRRAEMFKYIEASEGQTISNEDKATFKNMLDADFKATRIAYAQVKQLLGHMAYEKNYSLMSEKELMDFYRQSSYFHGKNEKKHGKHDHDSNGNKPERRKEAKKDEHANKDRKQDNSNKEDKKSWRGKSKEDRRHDKSDKRNKKSARNKRDKKYNKKGRKDKNAVIATDHQSEATQAAEIKQ